MVASIKKKPTQSPFHFLEEKHTTKMISKQVQRFMYHSRGSLLFNPVYLKPHRFYSGSPEEPVAQVGASDESKLKSVTDLLEEKEREIVELKDLYRRALADAENLRHRTQKELQEKTAYAIQSFAKDLLTTADFLSMALEAVPEHERGENATHKELKNLYVGVSLTERELKKTFGNYGVVGYNPMGEQFDFNKHTAIFQSKVSGKEPGTVFHVDKVGILVALILRLYD